MTVDMQAAAAPVVVEKDRVPELRYVTHPAPEAVDLRGTALPSDTTVERHQFGAQEVLLAQFKFEVEPKPQQKPPKEPVPAREPDISLKPEELLKGRNPFVFKGSAERAAQKEYEERRAAPVEPGAFRELRKGPLVGADQKTRSFQHEYKGHGGDRLSIRVASDRGGQRRDVKILNSAGDILASSQSRGVAEKDQAVFELVVPPDGLFNVRATPVVAPRRGRDPAPGAVSIKVIEAAKAGAAKVPAPAFAPEATAVPDSPPATPE